MPRSFFQKSLIASALAFACAPIHAEIFQLGQIEVRAENSKDLSTLAIDQNEIQQNNLTNVAQLGKTQAGIFFERKGGRAEQNILVRGFNSTRVPVFIDGIPVYVPYDGNMDLGRFMTFDLARVDISKGASSVLYGANTMGGAINLISQKPSQDFEGKLGYGFQTGRNSHTASNQLYFNLGSKQEFFYAQLSGSFLEQQGLQLSGSYHAHQFNTEQGGRAENSVSRDKKLSLKLAFTPNAQDEYALTFSTQKGLKQQPIYAGNIAKSERYWRWPAWDKNSIYFLSHTEFAPYHFYINSKAFYDSFKNDLDFFEDSTFSQLSSQSHYRDYSYGAGIELGADILPQDSLKFSAQYKADVHRERNDDEPQATDKDRTYSLALENSYAFSPQTKLITGLSYDYRQARQAQNYQEIKKKQKGLYQFEVGNQHAFNYQIKLAHNFTEDDELHLSFAKKSRFPSMKDRYSRRLGRNQENPYLGAETAYHYEIGYMRTFDNWLKLEGALFYSEVKNAIESIKLSNGLEQNQNYGKEAFKGLELALSIFATDNLKLGANYSYLRAKNRQDSSYIIKDVPRHKVFAYMDWQFAPKFALYISQEAETGRYSTNGMGKNSKVVKLAGFGVTNFKLSYQANAQFSIETGINNLFDKNYFYSAGYPEQGRLYFTNLKYQF